MRVEAADYEGLKGFLAWMFGRVIPLPPNLAPEDHPLAALERFEVRSKAMARKSLAMAVADIVELTQSQSPKEVLEIDKALRDSALPTLSEVRVRFSRVVGGLLRRGKVRSENEYHMLRNAVEMLAAEQQAKAWDILADFDERAGTGET
jgi:hypothetical protein